MKIAQRLRRHYKYAGEDVSMYLNATRFLWRVFTHPKNSPEHQRARAAGDRAYVPAYRSRVRSASLAKEQVRA